MNFDDLRRRADRVREFPLESVLVLRGAVRDPRDRSKWHTERGTLSITGPKFINWAGDQGGGGAIDLVMHLIQVDYRTAVAWLEQHVAVGHLTASQATSSSVSSTSRKHTSAATDHRPLQLPAPEDRLLGQVRRYLTRRRHLLPSLLEPLFESGKLYADRRGNAVFLMVAGKANRPVGAELRGTGPRVWRGMASGTRKDSGYFWIGVQGGREIVLCESAIDAISCYQLYPERICLSTSGVRANPAWLTGLLVHGYGIHCGFDADTAGDAAAARMIALHPSIQRLRPPAHDWNDALLAAQ